MSGLLDVTIDGVRIRCSAAVGRDLGQDEIDELGLLGGDLLLSSSRHGGWLWVIRAADRRALAAAIAPPGALIGNPPEIAPLLEQGGGC